MDSAKVRQVNTVSDISGMHPVTVWAIITPESVEAVADAVARSDGPISIGGGRYSMGGHVASANSLHLDLRLLNEVISFSPLQSTIRVQAGIRWRDLIRFIDPHDLSIRIPQTYGNFTVGGSLSVNAHGACMGQGPLVDSVRSIRMVMADGALIDASLNENPEIFYGAIGGYGALGVIVEAELELTRNRAIRRVVSRLKLNEYADQFRLKTLATQKAVLHHAELYGHKFRKVRSVTWFDTDDSVSEPGRMQMPGEGYSISGTLGTAINDNVLSRIQRNYITGPMADLRPLVHYRNFQTSYDVGELMPNAKALGTGTLQEYMIPLSAFETFIEQICTILKRHRVNTVDISVRHAEADPGCLLAWARGETMCVMLHHRHRKVATPATQTAIWTRELIDAAIDLRGAHFLPYDILATPKQFLAAYPGALELFALKARLDPGYRFRNALWDQYYDPALLPGDQSELDLQVVPADVDPKLSAPPEQMRGPGAGIAEEAAAALEARSEFRAVFDEPARHDGFYRFLQNIYKQYPEERFHALIKQLIQKHDSDEAVYRNLVRELPRMRPTLRQLFHAAPAFAKHKEELALHTLELLGSRRTVNGYMEIGSNGRYLSALSKRLRILGKTFDVNEKPPSYSLSAMFERGRLWGVGNYVPLNDYQALSAPKLEYESIDLVTCYAGLHHCPPEQLDAFVSSVIRLIRPGGHFILRDHDVPTVKQRTFVSLAHTVTNAGEGLSWEDNQREPRNFAPSSYWTQYLEAHGLRDTGLFIQQMDDPSDQVLMGFIKPE